MKKKILAIVCVFAFIVSMLAACGSSADTTVTDDASPVEEGNDSSADTTVTDDTSPVDAADYALIKDGTLSVGCEVGYPPFEDFDENNNPVGVDIDIITEVATRLGLEVEIINTAWDGIFAGIDVNYDVVCSAVTITPERGETMLFSDPYIDNYQSVMVMADSGIEIGSFMDLDGMTIAVQKETTSDILMSDYNDTGTISVNIIANEKVTSCFTQLENGEVDAVVCDSTVSDGQLAKKGDIYTEAFRDTSEPEQFGIAMGLNNTGLQAAVNDALAEMKEDGTLSNILNSWFGE